MHALSLPTPPPDSALRVRLQEFNLLPSRLWHPAREPGWQRELQALGALASRAALVRVLHRRWSAQLLAALGPAALPVTDLAHPALALALAPAPLLQQLQRRAGVLLLAPRLRRVVRRSEVLALREALGAELLQWAYGDAEALMDALAQGRGAAGQGAAGGSDAELPADPAAAADLLGAGLLAQSWHDAPAGLKLRADGRLPPGADDAAVRTASGLDAARARHLCRQLLASLDSTWLSSFPATP